MSNEKSNGTQHNNSEKLLLNLEVKDAGTIQYLNQFDPVSQNERALEALKIGSIAIQSATPAIDTRFVQERFNEFSSTIDGCMIGFNDEITNELDNYFNSRNGTLNKSLDNFLGDGGKLANVLYQYFGSESGHLLSLISKQVGPGSGFAKSLDPENKQGVICKIEDTVKAYMKKNSLEILGQFSLDVEDSAISRLKDSIMTEMKELREYNGQFFTDLKGAMGFQSGKEEEAEKGTEKGREFEVALYDRVAEFGRNLGDQTEIVRSITGSIPRSKKGDYKLTLGDTSGAPGLNVAVEVKKEKGYRMKDAIDELKDARKNRDAVAGIFVFAESCAPSEVGNFLRIGNDFYVTVDDNDVYSPTSTIYFEAAYNILRAVIISNTRSEEAESVDIDKVRAEVDSAVETVSRMSDLVTKAKTIKNSSIKIESVATDLKAQLEERLTMILSIINTKRDS